MKNAMPEHEAVDYEVDIDPVRHQLQVRMRLPAQAAGVLRLETPTWVPGDYSFAPYARDLFACQVRDASGAVLALRRDGQAGYRVAHDGGALTVEYRADAAAAGFGEACGRLGSDNGVLLGTRYLRVAGHEGPCVVHYRVPDGWPIHHPSGARYLGAGRWEYSAYEELLDTPVCFGQFERITRVVRGTEFHHVFLNRAMGFDEGVERFVDDLDSIAATYHDMFGAFPFADYTFVMSFNPIDAWGLEHLSSTMVGLHPATFYDADQYRTSVRVCAHELFHAWNVRRLRPAPLDKLAQALEQGSFTDGLWVAEGFTRYYEFLACTRTGIYSPQQFFSAVSNYFAHLSALPAYRRVSPADASSASYLNHEKYPGRANSAIDYYDAGMVMAFELDATLRLDADGQSLDRAFAAFYHQYAGRGAGYRIEDLCSFVGDLVPGLGRRLLQQATEPARLALPQMLSRLGLVPIEEDRPYLGLILQQETGPAIASVLDDSPAGASGLAAQDIVCAVNGYPYSRAALLQAGVRGREVVLDVMRGNEAYRFTIAPATRPALQTLVWHGSPAQAALIAAWLDQPFAPSQGQQFPLDFYENFHGVETVL